MSCMVTAREGGLPQSFAAEQSVSNVGQTFSLLRRECSQDSSSLPQSARQATLERLGHGRFTFRSHQDPSFFCCYN